jgi:hypothetical protein
MSAESTLFTIAIAIAALVFVAYLDYLKNTKPGGVIRDRVNNKILTPIHRNPRYGTDSIVWIDRGQRIDPLDSDIHDLTIFDRDCDRHCAEIDNSGDC